jgi:hypothetical protein
MDALKIEGAVDIFGGMDEEPRALDAFEVEVLNAPPEDEGMTYAEAVSGALALKLGPVLRALEHSLLPTGRSVVAGIYVHPDRDVVVHTLAGGCEHEPAYHRVLGVRAGVLPLSPGVLGGSRVAFLAEELEAVLREEVARVRRALRRARGQEVLEPLPLETPITPESAFGRAIRKDAVRICGILMSEGVTTVGELLSMSAKELLKMPMMGKKHLEAIECVLTPRGQSLREEE